MLFDEEKIRKRKEKNNELSNQLINQKEELMFLKKMRKKNTIGAYYDNRFMKNVENQNSASSSPEMRALLDELKKLNLTEDELTKVLKDLNEGPQVSPPGSPPSSVSSFVKPPQRMCGTASTLYLF